MDFALDQKYDSLRPRVREFIANDVLPLEADYAHFDDHENIALDKLASLREKAKQAGLWAPQSPVSRGGLNLPIVAWALLKSMKV